MDDVSRCLFPFYLMTNNIFECFKLPHFTTQNLIWWAMLVLWCIDNFETFALCGYISHHRTYTVNKVSSDKASKLTINWSYVMQNHQFLPFASSSNMQTIWAPLEPSSNPSSLGQFNNSGNLRDRTALNFDKHDRCCLWPSASLTKISKLNRIIFFMALSSFFSDTEGDNNRLYVHMHCLLYCDYVFAWFFFRWLLSGIL